MTQIQELWDSFDLDGSNDITFEEFEMLLITIQANRIMVRALGRSTLP